MHDDLFGHVPQKGELFQQKQTYTGPVVHTADTIREKFLTHLAEAKAADSVPWTPRMLQSYRAMAPYWAEWLKGGEGDRLLAEFRAELVRLGVDPINPLAQQGHG